MQTTTHDRIGRHVASVTSEGIGAGTFAASGVAVVYLVTDLLLDRPLETLGVLGRATTRLVGLPALGSTPVTATLAYLVLHYLAFALLGVVVAAVVRRARCEATVLAGAVLAGALLVGAVTEVAFVGLVALLRIATVAGALTWEWLAVGNVLGWLLLGASIWRRHPELADAVRAALRGTGAWSRREHTQ